MIQRIQTIWLLLASLSLVGLYYFDVYRADVVKDMTTVTEHLKMAGHYPSLLVGIAACTLSFLAIFFFRNRKRQRGMVVGALIVVFGFIGVNQMRISNFNKETIPAPADGAYYIGTVLPILAIIFLVLAIRGINKDEKLIRSMDRLR